MSGARRIAIGMLGERHVGILQCLANAIGAATYSDPPFNGQQGRQRLFRDIIGRVAFHEIVETGTFRGDTAAFMARESGLPVFTCEHSPRHFSFSRTRFVLDRDVRVAHIDSREFLAAHFAKANGERRSAFVYLDAHWGPDLPLFEETRILFAAPHDVVVMIDDFRVPDDPGYRCDSYGPGATLELDYLRIGELPETRIFFPAVPSGEETGACRGCVVLAREGPTAAALRTSRLLRPWTA